VDSSRYAELFLTESREHLMAINHAMLELERTSGGADAVSALFRAVHTLKGMSATMGYASVTELTHELETLLDRVRRGEQTVTVPLMDVLFQAADALEEGVELAVSGRADQSDVSGVVARLRRAASRDEGAPASPAESAPTSGSGDAPAGPMRDWSITPPAGDGVAVRVRISAEAPLPGVRAYLVLQKAKSLGELGAVVPPADALQADDFDREIAFRLVTELAPTQLELSIRAAGEVEDVEVVADAFGGAPPRVEGAAANGAEHNPSTATRSGDVDSRPAPGAALRQQRHVRIDLRRLDALMNLIGELVITRGRLVQLIGAVADPALDETVAQASRLITDLQDEIMTSRMVPVAQVFDRFPRLVRDAARTLGKEVEFHVEGQEIELDRSMLDEIGEPIVHLLRNAIDHGIELPDARRAAGKPAAGRLVLSASRDRSSVLIRVSDDGRGVDRAKVLSRAQAAGLVDVGRTELSDEELVRLISRPGFSTADRVSDISGRGVGIDAVQNRVRTLGGSFDIRSAPGEGTSVTVRLPLTLAIVRALLARIGGETYALTMTHVSETVELDPAALRTVRGREVLVLRDEVLPLLRLRAIVGAPVVAAAGAGAGVTTLDDDASDETGAQVVILEVGGRRAGLVVDELTGQQEIVVKQFDAVRGDATRGAGSLFAGVTILGDGAPALILDVSSLL
jgi:two-component system chemotaxis sensor kinase CheA